MLLGENSNSIERELANESASHNDTEGFSHPRGNSPQENEIRHITNENEAPTYDKLLESMDILSNEMNMKELDSSMSMMHYQTIRAIRSAFRDRVVRDKQNITRDKQNVVFRTKTLSLVHPLIIKILVKRQVVKRKTNKEGF